MKRPPECWITLCTLGAFRDRIRVWRTGAMSRLLSKDVQQERFVDLTLCYCYEKA
jgi:hypothetical protein